MMWAPTGAKEGDYMTIVIDGVNKYDPLPKLSSDELLKRAEYNRTMLVQARNDDRPESAKMYTARMDDCLDEMNKRIHV